ncbi:amidohydrolase family protein [Polycladidibacter hongkongensis]|uniref:amidohydrolase family protein n=1 Tax=Polycladidibacter hongkongensis TaxID=1647556 RepID=UPI00082A8036|nr:amidohydrolase family protein [Pseudovibrio hongkongensis]
MSDSNPKQTPIINCHTHIFTLDHVPDNFLPLGLAKVFRWLPFRRLACWLLRALSPFDSRDLFSRYANFLEVGAQPSQADVLNKLTGYYPPSSRFIVLPMDMAFMGAGEPAKDIYQQHEELAELARNSRGHLLPFIAIDPRRHSRAGTDLRQYAQQLLDKTHTDGTRIFKGIKLYPPLGYLPIDVALEPIWELCDELSLPVMTHCSRGGVKSKDLAPSTAAHYADPDHYRTILSTYPNMRLCLAHFGGSQDWQKFFYDVGSRQEAALDAPHNARAHMNWLTKIMQMIKSGEYPNLYTDISYTVFNIEDYMPALKVFLRDNRLRSRTLFGSDFYMSEQEVFEECFLSIKLRAELGEKTYSTIARTNPVHYLNGLAYESKEQTLA